MTALRCHLRPTASGKTALAIELAQATGAAILNADPGSMPTCGSSPPGPWKPKKPPPSIVSIGILPGSEPCSVARWVALAKAEIAALAPRPVILVGGTGLYLKALYEGLSIFPNLSRRCAMPRRPGSTRWDWPVSARKSWRAIPAPRT